MILSSHKKIEETIMNRALWKDDYALRHPFNQQEVEVLKNSRRQTMEDKRALEVTNQDLLG